MPRRTADGAGRTEARPRDRVRSGATTRSDPVFLVDDHALFRSGVRAELDRGVPDVTVVGEAGSVDEAVAAIRHLQPDVVLLDVHMPDGGGAEVLRQVRPELPGRGVPRAVACPTRPRTSSP